MQYQLECTNLAFELALAEASTTLEAESADEKRESAALVWNEYCLNILQFRT